uniref:Peroxidase n=1 Tax=Oryza brachyantha TaxID=4533 RepID=J3MLJ7_ORYBR
MQQRQLMKLLALSAVAVVVLSAGTAVSTCDKLKVGHYRQSCRNAESVVRDTVKYYFSRDQTVTAPLLRLHFHDCFVRGCDGSVLLNATAASGPAEKDAMPNQSLDGFYVIDAAKAALEKECPGVVSCADILALVARDAVSMAAGNISGPSLWQVPTGRLDGRVSSAAGAREAVANLPSSFADFAALKLNFAKKGLNVKDLAILSGAHAIGNSHCVSFAKRLYNFTGKGDADPTLDVHGYAALLRAACPPQFDSATTVEMVPGSSTTFDTDYYKLVASHRGLFHSDQALLQDGEAAAIVAAMASTTKQDFFRRFAVSMVRMGNVGVLTGTAGEIRKNCAMVN